MNFSVVANYVFNLGLLCFHLFDGLFAGLILMIVGFHAPLLATHQCSKDAPGMIAVLPNEECYLCHNEFICPKTPFRCNVNLA